MPLLTSRQTSCESTPYLAQWTVFNITSRALMILAFGVFSLDTYMAIIADLAMIYGRTLFYEYHQSFSAKSAMFIQRFNQRLDWSVVDLALISRHCTGRQALSCFICASFFRFLSKISGRHPKSSDMENKVIHFSSPICFNFNVNVCRFMNCKYIHACSFCGDGHPKSMCPRRTCLGRQKK